MAAAARKARTAEGGPKKVDPTAPAPTPSDAVVRAKASRPTFRRAGLVFSDRDWTVIDPEVGDEVSLAILAEPVLTIQVNGPDGWVTMTAEARADMIAAASKEDAKD